MWVVTSTALTCQDQIGYWGKNSDTQSTPYEAHTGLWEEQMNRHMTTHTHTRAHTQVLHNIICLWQNGFTWVWSMSVLALQWGALPDTWASTPPPSLSLFNDPVHLRAAVISAVFLCITICQFPTTPQPESTFLLCRRNCINISLLKWKGWTVRLLLTQGKGKRQVQITFGITDIQQNVLGNSQIGWRLLQILIS